MESGEKERLLAQHEIDPGAVDRLAFESLKKSSELLSIHLMSDDYGSVSAGMHDRITEEIRMSKQLILMRALSDEWSLALDDYPLHRALGVEIPDSQTNEGGFSVWGQPLMIPELPEYYVDACVEAFMNQNADFRDLDDIHRDYRNRPKLFEMIRSINSLSQGSYHPNIGDAVYTLVESGLFSEEYTLDYDGSLYLLAFLPQETSQLVQKMMAANQISARMDETLLEYDLDESEQLMSSAIKNVLRADALTGPAWHEFARSHGGISERGSEQLVVSAEGLQSLLQARRLARRGNVNRVSNAYMSALESACYGIMGVIETASVNNFALGSPEEIARAQFNTPLRLALSSDPKLYQQAIQPAKTDKKAVIVDQNLAHSLITRQIIHEQSPYRIDEDTMFKELDPASEWVTDPHIAMAAIDINSRQPAYFFEYIKSILKSRLEMSELLANPNFHLVIWSTESETVAAIQEWIIQITADNDVMRGALLSGELTIERPFANDSHSARVKIKVQPKQAVLPRPEN